jgi:myo-inositol-1(or 4)-monophosphatase
VTTSAVLDVLVAAAREGERVVQATGGARPRQARTKSSSADLVTEIDVRVQDVVTEFLLRRAPGACVVGEEAPGPAPLSDERIYLDPIDGTLNFVHGFDEHALSIGYWRGDAPVAGVVLKLSTGELFTAERGRGAFRDGVPIHASARDRIDEALVATGWPYDKSRAEAVLAEMRALIARCQEIRIIGSAALAMCYVAAGVLDAFWETGLEAWDLAAGSAIALEAGATVTNPHGAPFELRGGAVLASNGRLHARMTELLASAGERQEALPAVCSATHLTRSGGPGRRLTHSSRGGQA